MISFGQSKKPRVSAVSSDVRYTTAVDDVSSSDEAPDDDDGGLDFPPQTQYEIMRDNGFKHLENLQEDDERATRHIARERSNYGENMIAESGIIQSITCYNFMCHERLHVELGPLINFIVGENGSGKSAVLTALTLCLGGKASDTNRGGSLKSFVKEGREQGSLVVRIKNGGPGAYQPHLYGNLITVERHFSKSGASGFKVKNEQDKIVSTKKHEIDEISEWFALQMGNPLTVLSQDNARQFLNSASPAQKYKYFVSGVQLEQLDNDYKMSQDTLERTLILHSELDGKVAHVKKQMEDAQRLAETAQKNTNLREKLRHLRNQLAWYQVAEQERALEARNVDLVRRDGEITRREAECDDMTKALQETEEKLERVKSVRDALGSERSILIEKTSEVEETYNTVKKELVELHREERDAHARLKTMIAEIRSCETKIKEEEQRLGESTGAARAEKEQELAEARDREAELRAEIDEAAEQVPVLRGKVTEADLELKNQQRVKELKRKDILAGEALLKQMEQSTGSAHDGYDKDMLELVKAIGKSKDFEHQPIGPLGAHIRLLEPDWSGILEKTFGETLNAFVVRSKKDQTALSGLIRRIGMKKPPPINIAYGGRLDTSSQEPDSSFQTVLRVLQFDDEIVRSQLIINSQIEKIILVRDRVEAEGIMIDNAGPPRNVTACLCFHDGKSKRGQGLRITNRNGTTSTAPVIPTMQRPRMQSDSGQQLSIQKENLNQLGREMLDLAKTERLAKQNLEKCKRQLETHGDENKKLTVKLRHAQADMERAAEELDAFEGADDRLVLLRSDLENKRVEEDQLGSQYGDLTLAKTDLNTKVENAKKVLEACRADDEAFEERLSKANLKVNNCETLRQIAVSNKNAAFEGLDIERSERRRAEAKRDQKVQEVEEFTEQATEVAPDRVHIPESETYESIEQKYSRINEQLKQRERRIGATDEQIFQRAEQARVKYEEVVQEAKDVDETIMALKKAISYRLHRWREFQKQISARIRIQFNYLLSERGFRGKINFDHRQKQVLLQIEPDETRKSNVGRDTKTLSGGEKSFSSICMLLSVWEAIGSPIRCLDEFDVFMDNVNRAISTDMLVDTARRSVSRQYILITPNAIEGRAKVDKDVKVIR